MFSNSLISVVLLSAEAFHQLSFRRPLKVLQIRCFPQQGWTAVYPVCPRCGVTMEREYQHFCDRCGQKLDWSAFSLNSSLDKVLSLYFFRPTKPVGLFALPSFTLYAALLGGYFCQII